MILNATNSAPKLWMLPKLLGCDLLLSQQISLNGCTRKGMFWYLGWSKTMLNITRLMNAGSFITLSCATVQRLFILGINKWQKSYFQEGTFEVFWWSHPVSRFHKHGIVLIVQLYIFNPSVTKWRASRATLPLKKTQDLPRCTCPDVEQNQPKYACSSSISYRQKAHLNVKPVGKSALNTMNFPSNLTYLTCTSWNNEFFTAFLTCSSMKYLAIPTPEDWVRSPAPSLA